MKNHKPPAVIQNITSILVLLFGFVQPVIASPVPLQQPTATFSQSTFGDFSVAKAINGTTADNLGWAIELDPFVNITAQTAVFETVTDVGFGAGSVITFSLSQTFPNPGPFTLGRFRFSVTTDNRSLFADGLASGGDVTANWTILNPTIFLSANGATLSKLGDLSILASGPAPLTDLYTISAPTSLTGITGIRLEVLEDPSLPFGGPGRHPDHGSFVLSELQMDIVAAQSNCVTLASGLVSWWRGENNADDGVGTNRGILQNGTGFGSGLVGQALSFDGISNYVTIPASPSLDVGSAGGLTVECWIKPAELSVARPLVEYNDGVNDGVQLWISQPWVANQGGPGSVFANIVDTGGGTHALVSAPGILTTNQFHHVAVTYDKASGLGRLYADGVVVFAANLGTFTPRTSSNLLLGLRPAGSPNPSIYSGLMDEVSVYSRALTTNEIQAVFAAGSAGKCTTPVPPYIISQPTNQTVSAGTTVTLAVLAGGTPPLRYQWSFNGSTVAEATNASLIFTNVGANRTGVYVVTVTNLQGSILSSNAGLTVNAVTPGTLLNVNFAANQVKTGFAATGLTGSDFWNGLWFPFQPSAGLGGLQRADGTATGAGLTVQNGAGHTGFSHPDLMYQSCCYAQDYGVITLTVTNLPAGRYDFYLYGHAGADTANTVFQLLVGGNDFGNKSTATNSSWSLTNWVEGAQYVVYRGVTVTNGGAPVIVKCHPGVSGYTYLNGLQIMAAGPTPPVIVSQPASQDVLVGANVTLSVGASGTPPLSYQWRFNGTNVAGATASSLTKTNVQLGDAGNYAVVVSNSVGTVTSSNAVLTVNSALPCASPASGLVGWWRAEGEANDFAGGNHGALAGGTTFGAAEVGQGFYFNGTNAYVSIAASANLNVGVGGGLTIEGWLKPGDVANPQVIVEWNNGVGGIGAQLWHSIDALGGLGSLFANLSDTSGNDHYFATSPSLLDTSDFQHIALTYDKISGVAKLYRNGVTAATQNLGVFTPQTSYPFYLGTRFSGSGAGAFYKGLIDEMAVYNRALTTNEIQAIYNAGSAGKCSTPAPPVVFTQPTNQTVAAGASVTFAVAAGGSPPLRYQWSFNSNMLVNATNASLTITNAGVDQAGVYAVTITNMFGATSSSNALLTVLVFPPSLLLQPTNQTRVAGETATLAVTASGSAPLSYQWSFNGSPVPAATNASLVFPSLGTNHAGVYAVTVRNFFGSETSSNATLAVVFLTTNLFDDFDPGIDLPQWLSFSGTVQATNHGGFVSPSNSLWFGGVNSRFAITRSINTTNSWNLRFHLRFGSGAPPFWDRPELPIDGVVLEYSTNAGVNWIEFGRYNTTTFYNWTPVSALVPAGAKVPAARFRWRQLANSGSISDHWALDDVLLTEVVTPPEILTQPLNQTVGADGTATFSAGVSGSLPLYYQWRLNGTDLGGATNSSLTLNNAQPSQAGNYSLSVANVAGVAASSNAVLKVTVISAFGNSQLLTEPVHYFSSSLSVELTNHFPGGLIFYTLDGSAPSFASSQYPGPFQVSQTVVLRAIGYRADFLESGELGPITILKVPGFTLSVSSGGGGSITLNPPGGGYSSNTVVNLTAVPNPGWTFLKWLGDADGSSSATNVTVTRNKSVQAVFGTTLNTTAAGGGSVALNPPGGVYAFGSVVQITAIPNPGSFFGLWGSAASGNVNPLLFTVTNPNPTVSSIFGAVGSSQAALTVVPVGRGQVSINPRANVYPTNSAVTITATPDAGQSFLGWSGNASGTQNPLQLTLDANKLIYANFTRRPQLTAEMLHNEGFRLSLIGDGAATYRLEMSTNLTAWAPLAEITNAVGTAQFIDLAATNAPQRFYRALILP